MSLETGIVLGVHVLAGVLALLAGLGAIATKKGRNRHNTAGKAYVAAMGVVVVTAVPLAVWIESWFLLAIAIFSGYLVVSGYRIIRRRRRRVERPTKRDYLLQGSMLSAGAVMLATGGLGTVELGPVLVVFGVIGIVLAVRELWTLRRAGGAPWIDRHITYMGGGYIATVTATVTVNLTMLPPLARWLGPTAVGTPLIVYAVNHYRPVFAPNAGT
ncbi:hypothetical protein [Halovenus halobia]|uniref:hypothetical protein n=1 Tax=Halovenus halobia TaxID=3396622 RepID=UPI003F5536DE